MSEDKRKHLTLESRTLLQTKLDAGESFSSISQVLHKAPSTISREVQAHRVLKKVGGFGNPYNPCANRRGCKATRLCSVCNHPEAKRCSHCPDCQYHCPQFQEEVCPKLSKPPYCCNGCSTRSRCTLNKLFYHAKTAQEEYEQTRSESRRGMDISPEELRRVDAFVSPLIQQGQSIHHICVSNRDVVMCSPRTVYNLVNNGLLEAERMELPRAVRMKPRKKKDSKKVDRHCYENRTYQDFLTFTADNPEVPVVEMDSVIGTREQGKVLLTTLFRSTGLFLAFLREANTARSVQEAIDGVYTALGRDTYCDLFTVLLTDRGSEFSNPTALEHDADGELRSLVFYCDPNAPYQKGRLEVCHELLRRILPKGRSFDDLTQKDVDLICCHINSYTREKLNNRSAYQLSSFLYGEDVLRALNLHEIPANDIILSPKLLKK